MTSLPVSVLGIGIVKKPKYWVLGAELGIVLTLTMTMTTRG